MSKLLKLKEWLTLDEAAQHITSITKATVSVADLLRFALERHLTISVNLVNLGYGQRGLVKSSAEGGTWKPFPLMRLSNGSIFRSGLDLEFPRGRVVGPDAFLVIAEDEPVVRLDGIWDLPLIGGETIALERELQSRIGGPPVEKVDSLGSLLAKPGHPSELWQVMEPYPRNHTPPQKHVPDKSGQGVLDSLYTWRRYFPSSGLPDGSLLVLRVEELQRFLAELSSEREELNPRAEATYQNIIAGLLELMLEKGPQGKPRSGYLDQSSIIDQLVIRFSGKKSGLSKRTLETKFAKAKQNFGSD